MRYELFLRKLGWLSRGGDPYTNNTMDKEEFATKLSWLRQGHCYFLLSMENITGGHESKKVYITVCGHKSFSHILLNMVLLESKGKSKVD